jgi:hypothetical protein
MKADTYIVFSCDQNYFPLAKGLVLSLQENGPLPEGICLAFLDIGCDAASRAWLIDRGVRMRSPDPCILGPLADESLGYRRSQASRPFLPRLFPEARTLLWIDCDTWIQDASIFPQLRAAVAHHRDKLFVTPELHYSYTAITHDPDARREEMYSYYQPTFGSETAARLAERPTLNSGFFAMDRDNRVWPEWEREVRRLYLEGSRPFSPIVLHMAEQVALNVVASRGPRVRLIDPLYNYLALWTRPRRDADGIVRVALPPHPAVGIVHLAGGWRFFGETYFREKLLYRSGDYLSDADKATLFRPRPAAGFR